MFSPRLLLVFLFTLVLTHADLHAAPKVPNKIGNFQLPPAVGLDLSNVPQFGSQRRPSGGDQRQQPGTPPKKSQTPGSAPKKKG